MAATKISDLVIVPETFLAYVEKLILMKSALFQSGFVASVPTFIPSRGKLTNSPYYLGFDGADEVLSDSASLTVNSVGSNNAVSVINFRGKSFGADDLVDMLSGADPLGSLANKFADYWVRMLNATTLSTLQGAVGGAEAAYGAGTIINDGSLAVIDGNAVIDTLQLMGEFASDLTLMVMHSAVLAKLQKNDLTKDVIVESTGSQFTTYMGRQIIVDDTLVPAVAVYTTYLVSAGAMLYSQGIDPALAIETDRDILAGEDIVTSRSRYIMHAAGSSWTGTATGVGPTNTELATAGNWGVEDAGSDKRFPIRALTHLI